MSAGLRRHPKVVRMASALRADKLRVIGGLHAVWCVFDEHSPDGLLEGYTLSAMDEEIGWKGFSQAMQAIGWLIETESGLEAPDYEEHNGASAKRRALDARRKKEGREADNEYGGSWTASGQMSALDADKTQTRKELDKKTPTESRQRGSRLPAEWTPGPGGFEFAAKAGLVNGRAQSEAEKFRDYWVAQPGQKGVKLDWDATWRTWVRTAVDRFPQPSRQTADIYEGAR
jgi:hypothetical protein